MSRFRELVADAALTLWQSGRRVSQEWFAMTRPENILERAALFASLAQVSIKQYREQHGSRVIAAPGSEIHKAADGPLVSRGMGIVGAVPGSPIRIGDGVIGYVGGENPVADAAQWLYHNRGARIQTLAYKTGQVIVRMYQLCRAADEAKAVNGGDKKYSLSDLRRAYDLGFGASGECWNQEIHPNYISEENYQAERKEALRGFE